LEQQGKTNLKHSLTKRCQTAISDPIDPSADPTSQSVALRTQLVQAKQELDALLNADFRIVPDIPSDL
ncbi:MAG TPA: hypothetical protein VK968_06250, partial [Roseimicrobium sp.]|nr:hypothetical protein [Roseimicrobium sp.]